MKIKIIFWEHDYYGTMQEMELDGKFVVSAGGGEPEDMIIGRNVISLETVARLMKQAFEAGKNGETWEYEYIPKPDES